MSRTVRTMRPTPYTARARPTQTQKARRNNLPQLKQKPKHWMARLPSVHCLASPYTECAARTKSICLCISCGSPDSVFFPALRSMRGFTRKRQQGYIAHRPTRWVPLTPPIQLGQTRPKPLPFAAICKAPRVLG